MRSHAIPSLQTQQRKQVREGMSLMALVPRQMSSGAQLNLGQTEGPFS